MPCLIFSTPESIAYIHNKNVVIYTMFESTKIPKAWVTLLNLDRVKRVIVPSVFCKKAFIDSGVKKPIDVIPLGVNHSIFNKHNQREKYKKFTFIHYEAFNVRKGFNYVWQAFNDLFSGNDDVQLILKTTRERLPFPIQGDIYKNIIVDKRNLRHAELAQLVSRCHCLLFPSLGEGMGMPPLEASAVGTATILTDAHSHKQYISKNFYTVKTSKITPVYRRYDARELGHMVKPDIDDLKLKMMEAYSNKKKTIKMGNMAQKEILSKYTIEDTASSLYELFSDII